MGKYSYVNTMCCHGFRVKLCLTIIFCFGKIYSQHFMDNHSKHNIFILIFLYIWALQQYDAHILYCKFNVKLLIWSSKFVNTIKSVNTDRRTGPSLVEILQRKVARQSEEIRGSLGYLGTQLRLSLKPLEYHNILKRNLRGALNGFPTIRET